jgi:hypothetical protein
MMIVWRRKFSKFSMILELRSTKGTILTRLLRMQVKGYVRRLLSKRKPKISMRLRRRFAKRSRYYP